MSGQLQQPRQQSSLNREASPSGSEASASSRVASPPVPAQTHIGRHAPAMDSSSSLASSQGPARRPSVDLPLRRPSPAFPNPQESRLRNRLHSQGFFEPTLPTASQPTTSPLSASQIAAQAAYGAQNYQHERKRSTTHPTPSPVPQTQSRRKPSGTIPSLAPQSSSNSGHIAAHAANAAFPRNPLHSPSPNESNESTREPSPAPVPTPEPESKPAKEKSRIKIFSKPKQVRIEDPEKKPQTSDSPKKTGYAASILSRGGNQSTTSLVDSVASSASSFYSSSNASSSTLVPGDKGEKEKGKHSHFLARQKQKHKDNVEHRQLQLSSASSNSRAADPSAPHTLYSFAPSSPSVTGSFPKSVTGLDLRHGGRALREKRKEEKAALSALSNVSTGGTDSGRDTPQVPADLLGSTSIFGPTSVLSNQSDAQNQTGFNLAKLTADEAWALLRARILVIFEGEDVRIPIEDFNRLLTLHLQKCIQANTPHIILEKVRDLLQTGFSSIEYTLRRVPDARIVPQLVEIWTNVFNTILPFLQAIFLPLDLELRGRGQSLSTPSAAADFWGVASRSSSTSLPDTKALVLQTFRDIIILPRHDRLLKSFSKSPLESIITLPTTLPSFSPPTAPSPPVPEPTPRHGWQCNSRSNNGIVQQRIFDAPGFRHSEQSWRAQSRHVKHFSWQFSQRCLNTPACQQPREQSVTARRTPASTQYT